MKKINTIEYKGKELKWEYDICPCLECPIYPHRSEWEDEKDIRKNKCYDSRCTYHKELSASMAWGLYEWRSEKE